MYFSNPLGYRRDLTSANFFKPEGVLTFKMIHILLLSGLKLTKCEHWIHRGLKLEINAPSSLNPTRDCFTPVHGSKSTITDVLSL